jgi:hypothetical protein
MTGSMKRAERTRKAEPSNVPRPVEGESELVWIDTTWGELQQIEPVPGVRTIGELELSQLVAAGAALAAACILGQPRHAHQRRRERRLTNAAGSVVAPVNVDCPRRRGG